jgi:tetratricopeptide (TPR) repeat protein
MRPLSPFSKLATVSVTVLSVMVGMTVALPTRAETFLEDTGTITPAEASYTFEGSAGQAVTITLDSEDFDPVLSLFDSSGNEVASNDDFGGTLNAAIILTLPAEDTYTVIARSFSGQGGDYSLEVRSSTDYETTYAEAQTLALEENYPGAIDAYTSAIAIDPDQPSAYLGRAEAYLGQVYFEQGDQIEGPSDIPLDVREAIIGDFEKAATLIEATGPQDWADSLREQADFLRGDQPEPEPPSELEM